MPCRHVMLACWHAMAWWHGMVAWHGGMAWWHGMLAWHGGMACWHGMLAWHVGMAWHTYYIAKLQFSAVLKLQLTAVSAVNCSLKLQFSAVLVAGGAKL